MPDVWPKLFAPFPTRFVTKAARPGTPLADMTRNVTQ